MAERSLQHPWLRALGREDMPARIVLEDGSYRHLRTFKHDFFAATGLYEGPSGRVVLKLGHVVSLFGLPMAWLGEWLADREAELYRAARDVEGVPRLMGRWGRTGFVHAFIEGHPLQRHEQVRADFFPRLERLLKALHARGIAYVDLEKRENILVDDRGLPWLIDFQISWPGPELVAASRRGRRSGGLASLWRLLPAELNRFILGKLQRADLYHLLKHRRRQAPETMTADELARSYNAGMSIRLHRRLFRPFTLLRRQALKRLTGHARSPKQEGPEFLEAVPTQAGQAKET